MLEIGYIGILVSLNTTYCVLLSNTVQYHTVFLRRLHFRQGASAVFEHFVIVKRTLELLKIAILFLWRTITVTVRSRYRSFTFLEKRDAYQTSWQDLICSFVNCYFMTFLTFEIHLEAIKVHVIPIRPDHRNEDRQYSTHGVGF